MWFLGWIFYYNQQINLINSCPINPLTLRYIFLMLSSHKPIKLLKLITLGIPVTLPDDVKYLYILASKYNWGNFVDASYNFAAYF